MAYDFRECNIRGITCSSKIAVGIWGSRLLENLGQKAKERGKCASRAEEIQPIVPSPVQGEKINGILDIAALFNQTYSICGIVFE